jgi:hypothetical protein
VFLNLLAALKVGEKHGMVACSLVLSAACFIWTSVGCKQSQPYSPTRPSNVSKSATYIQGPDGRGVWNACEYVNGHDECHIWAVGGSVLEEGSFIPYDGDNTPVQSDLLIAQQGGSSVIMLKNGRYLIPANGSGHEAAVRYLDFMTGKTKSFGTKKASEN